MPIVYCQLFSGEKLLSDQLLVSIESQGGPNAQAARGGTFRIPADQLSMIRIDQAMRLEFPEKVARRLKIAVGNSVHIVAHQIRGRVAHFAEAEAAGAGGFAPLQAGPLVAQTASMPAAT